MAPAKTEMPLECIGTRSEGTLHMIKKYTILSIVASLVMSGMTLTSAFGSDELENCPRLAAELGAENVWFGQVSGLSGVSPTNVWSAMGCFATETECRKWLYQSYPNNRTTHVLSCRQGAPRWSIR